MAPGSRLNVVSLRIKGKMKLLLEHHSNANLGDTAMIEGTVQRLTEVLPNWEIHVPDRPGLRTTLWSLPGVHRISDFSVMPMGHNRIAQTRFLWRFHGVWNNFVFKVALRSVGRFHRVGILPLHDGGRKQDAVKSLENFCQQFDALHIVGQSGLVEVFSDCLFQQCCLILAFAEQHKPVIMTGQQLGPLPSAIYRKLVLRVLRRVDFVGLREPTESVSICQEAQLPPQRFEVMGDDSFGMPPAPDEHVVFLLNQYGLKEHAFLAVNVRFASYTEEHRSHLQKIAAIIVKVSRNIGMPIVIVPISLNEMDSDIRAGKELREALGARDARIIDNEDLTSALIKGVLGKAFGAVCVSYHACTFALSQSVPAICMYDGTYYGQKARGICAYWGDNRLGIDLKEVNVGLAANQILDVLNDEALRKKLKTLSHKVIAQWQRIFDRRVRDIFGNVA